MQFIKGEDLYEKIEHRRGPFPPDQVTYWADQLLDALDYLHTQDPQIVHRDIKPQNLKVTARGQIILLDFGLAKGQGSEVSRVTITNRCEADTVLFPTLLAGSSGTTQAGLKSPTAVAGETTVVRDSATSLGATSLSRWAMLAVAVIVLVVGVGGFYAYQRGDGPQNQPAAQESKPHAEPPSNSEVVAPSDSTGDSAGTANTNAESSESPSPSVQTAKTSEKSSRERTTKKKSSAAAAAAGSEGHDDWDVVVTPQPPPASWRPSVPGTRPPRHPGPTIRTFRDGTQLITSPDGTGIVITPDGKRRVFRPGEKIVRENPQPSPEKSRP